MEVKGNEELCDVLEGLICDLTSTDWREHVKR
jgi:hypothetical protein